MLKNKKIIIPAIAVIALIVIVLIILILSSRLTKLEKMKLEEKSSEISNYLEEITENENDKGKYISFAIEYLYNTTDEDSFSYEEILEVINSNFNVSYNEEDIASIGITPLLQQKNIVLDSSVGGYKYIKIDTISDIANKKVYYFNTSKIEKINGKRFKIIYDKYVIENPYEVLNYYSDTKKDTTKIVGYLKGTEKTVVFKDIVRNEKNKNFGKKVGKTTVIYIIKDDNLLIDKIY